MPILTHPTWPLLAATLLLACDRTGFPNCPLDAQPVDQPHVRASDELTGWFFPSLAGRDDTYLFDAEAATLVQFHERPLPKTARAYRVIESGRLGYSALLERRGNEAVGRLRRWQVCEDGDYGMYSVETARNVALETWRAVDRCMQGALWRATEEKHLQIVDTAAYQCTDYGPHRVCVGGFTGPPAVEGTRNGVHVIAHTANLPQPDAERLQACASLLVETIRER